MELKVSVLCLLFTTCAAQLLPDMSNPCANKPDASLVANPKGCEYFYVCKKGEPIECYCQTGKWFHLDNEAVCDWPEEVDCPYSDKPPLVDPIGEHDIVCPEKNGIKLVYLPSKVDCGRYFICYDGKPIKQQCFADLHWNIEQEKCDFPINAKCKLMPECPKQGLAFFPHPYELNYFIFCLNSFSSVQQCPFYFHWDAKLETCRWKDVANTDRLMIV